LVERSDYSVVVKLRTDVPSRWRWMIYRAGLARPLKTSKRTPFTTRAEAQRAGEKVLQLLLGEHQE
jgi:hypothetical protein